MNETEELDFDVPFSNLIDVMQFVTFFLEA